jgi:hypothetical protein
VDSISQAAAEKPVKNYEAEETAKQEKSGRQIA